jgi:hypothetical protein
MESDGDGIIRGDLQFWDSLQNAYKKAKPSGQNAFHQRYDYNHL